MESMFKANLKNEVLFPVRVPVLRVNQPLGEFYAAVIPAELLLEVSYSNLFRVDEQGKLLGSQRHQKDDRIRDIGRFIDSVEASFPNSIILAANYDEETGLLCEDPQTRWRVEFADSEKSCGWLEIPSARKLAAVVDGQHRLKGFERVEVKERLQMPLLCAVYLDLPNPFQAFLFATINFNQKPVDKSQSYQLYGFNLDEEPAEAWSPEKAAVFMTRKLNDDSSSVFYEHILLAAQTDEAIQAAKEKKRDWAISTATSC